MKATGPQHCRPDQLFGAWAVEPQIFQALVEQARGMDLAQLATEAEARVSTAVEKPLYQLDQATGIAVVELSGPLTKYPTSFQSRLGGTSTVQARQALRAAVRDDAVTGILLRVESPGGTVAGLADLYDSIQAADRVKPTASYVEDLGASGALWAALAGRSLLANRGAQIGSIGAYVVLRDESGRLEQQGVRVHVVASGPFKGTGASGAPITDEQLAQVQRQIDALAEVFVQDLARARRMPLERARQLADGSMHMAEAALALGLIDGVTSFEGALEEMRRTIMEQDNAQALATEREARAVVERERDTLRTRVQELETAARAAANPPADELAGMPESVRTRLEANERELAQLRTRVRREEILAQVRTAYDGLSGATPEQLTDLLLALDDRAPEQAAALRPWLAAWSSQLKAGAVFSEKGTATARAGAAADGPEAQLRAIAQEIVTKGEAKDYYAGYELACKRHPELVARTAPAERGKEA